MPLLEVQDLSIQFGGVKAVQNVSFSIDAGIVYAVIGPNGAGKTTLFNLITGIYTPTSGSILLDGQSIQGKSPDVLAQRGVARTFQNLQICMNMSAVENVMVGAHLRLDRNLFKAALRSVARNFGARPARWPAPWARSSRRPPTEPSSAWRLPARWP